MRFIDPDGNAPDDIIILSKVGTELRRISDEGQDKYIQVDETAFNKVSNSFAKDNMEYNTILSVNSLRSQETSTGATNLISEQIGVSLSVTGSMKENSTVIANVSVSVQVNFDNGSSNSVGTYKGVGGGFGNGAPENGNYTLNNHSDRSTNGNRYNEGMNNDRVGFSYDLNPKFSTGRTDLRVHPDGGKSVGTLGCIGLSGCAKDLSNFRNTINNNLDKRGSLPVNINITNNPNNNGRSGKKIPNIHE
jgi:hypothetical protein